MRIYIKNRKPSVTSMVIHLLEIDDNKHQGRVVSKPINANPGLKVDPCSQFSGVKTFFTNNVLCTLRLFQLKTEAQASPNCTVVYVVERTSVI